MINENKVREKNWIYTGKSKIVAYVERVLLPCYVYAGFFQNGLKAINDEFVLIDDAWEFKSLGPFGSNLIWPLAYNVKQGPKS